MTKFKEIKKAMKFAKEFQVMGNDTSLFINLTKKQFLNTLVALDATGKLDENYRFWFLNERKDDLPPVIIITI